MLKDPGSFSFEVYFNDDTFDNDDNPYAKIKLHKYVNMDHPNDFYPSKPKTDRDVFRDELVPIQNCKQSLSNDTIWSTNTTIKYCPFFSDQDFLYGDYYSEKASWYRLSVHTCDIEERKIQNKTCKFFI